MESADHGAARDWAVQWMNRGHALNLGDSGMEALVAYAHAIALLRPLPLAENPAWGNSLGAALMNFGQLLHRVHGLARADEALLSFEEAIGILAAIPPDGVPWARRNLAGSRINRANLLLDLGVAPIVGSPLVGDRLDSRSPNRSPTSGDPTRVQSALVDARAALALVVATEGTDAVDAELALKARRALGDALGQQIVLGDTAQQEAIATEAADIVDDAFALVRHWAVGGESAFAPLAIRFFRFGVELYRRHQPHFLVEFIEENLDLAPADELRVIALATVDAAVADGAAPALLMLGDPASERALRTRRDLVAARARLESSSFVA